MKICSNCGKSNEDTAVACIGCGLNHFQTSQRTEPIGNATTPNPLPAIREILSDWSRLFRILLIISTVSYLITFFHFYMVSDHLQDALSWHGYGAILTLPSSISWLAMLLWLASAIGMWAFSKSARFLYTALVLFFVLLMFFSGVNVQTAFGSFFGAITNMSDGALLLIAYISPLKDRFV